MSHVIAVTDEIGRRLHHEMLIVLESTTYPGTTEEIIVPRILHNGLDVGRDVFVAFSPERIDPGRTDYTLANTPKVIGGVTPACGQVAAALYGCIVEQVVPVSSPAAAEMVKLLENTFRAVNIALVNEISLMCDKLDLDVWEVIEGAATKPFGFMPFFPGPGIGGHCIPLDPHYLSWKLKTLNYSARFIDLASDINGNMPLVVVRKAAELLNTRRKSVKGANILVLGVAYKRDTGDVRESPALDIMRLLEEQGAKVRYHDPYNPKIRLDGGKEYKVTPLTPVNLRRADLVLIVTDHSEYDYDKIVRQANLIFDTRNATRGVRAARIKIHKL